MLAVSSTVVNASINLTCRVAATHKSESDRARVRFSDLLMCADLTDLPSTNRPTISIDTWHLSTPLYFCPLSVSVSAEYSLVPQRYHSEEVAARHRLVVTDW